MDDGYFAAPTSHGSAPAASGTPVGAAQDRTPGRRTPAAGGIGEVAKRHRRWLVLGLVVCLAGVGARTVHADQAADLELPDTLAGLPVAPGALAGFDEKLRDEEFDGDASAIAAYGPGPSRRPLQMNLMLVAGDSRGKSDLRYIGPTDRTFDEVSCSTTMRFSADAPAKEITGLAVCWRSSRNLTVSVLVVGMSSDYLPQVAGAVDEAWAANA